MSVITVNNITKNFKGTVALNDFIVTFEENKFAFGDIKIATKRPIMLYGIIE